MMSLEPHIPVVLRRPVTPVPSSSDGESDGPVIVQSGERIQTQRLRPRIETVAYLLLLEL